MIVRRLRVFLVFTHVPFNFPLLEIYSIFIATKRYSPVDTLSAVVRDYQHWPRLIVRIVPAQIANQVQLISFN